MALIGTMSGSIGPGGTLTSNNAISGTLIIADAPRGSFPILGSGVKLLVFGNSVLSGSLVVTGSLAVTGSITTILGLTGSLTKLYNGSDYLRAGSNISLTTGSDGSVTVASTVSSTSPGGATTEVQFNDGGVFGSDNTFYFDKTNKIVNMTSGSAYHISASFGVYSPVFHSGIQILSDAASIAWDLNKGAFAQVTLGGARALAAPTNMRAGGYYNLIVKQDAAGGRTLSYASTYKFPYSTVPIISTGSNAVDILSFVSDGTNLYGSYVQSFG